MQTTHLPIPVQGKENDMSACAGTGNAPLKIILVGLITLSSVAVAQTSDSNTAADLTNVTLRQHSKLPKYFRAGPPIEQELAQAKETLLKGGYFRTDYTFPSATQTRLLDLPPRQRRLEN